MALKAHIPRVVGGMNAPLAAIAAARGESHENHSQHSMLWHRCWQLASVVWTRGLQSPPRMMVALRKHPAGPPVASAASLHAEQHFGPVTQPRRWVAVCAARFAQHVFICALKTNALQHLEV